MRCIELAARLGHAARPRDEYFITAAMQYLSAHCNP
jgi:hypothetical protein